MSKAKDKKRVDLDVRPNPNPLFTNYDLYGPEEGSDTSPGTGLYNGEMDKYKSVKDFIDKARKRKHNKTSVDRLEQLLIIAESLNLEIRRFAFVKEARIRKLPNGQYRVVSEKGKNLGTYDSFIGARNRLRQVEYFKHKVKKGD